MTIQSDLEQPAGLTEVSENTRQLLEQACIRRMPNKERLAQQNCYPLPRVPATRTPSPPVGWVHETKRFFKGKTKDRELAKVQTLILDAPLSWKVMREVSG